jgi:hypothetical protein
MQLGLDGDSEEDDLRIAEILAQMDAAGEVADDLEEKLDLLLENLGKAEVEMKRSPAYFHTPSCSLSSTHPTPFKPTSSPPLIADLLLFSLSG